MSEELQACPFCGGDAAMGTVHYSDSTVREQQWAGYILQGELHVVQSKQSRGVQSPLDQII